MRKLFAALTGTALAAALIVAPATSANAAPPAKAACFACTVGF
ncbi:hypothetical protein [Nakamurella aerolata]|nr:hypothetical protein [Nakamurella aerolata]